MKFLINALALLLASCCIVGVAKSDELKQLHAQYTDTVILTITNQLCAVDELKQELPFAAYYYDMEADELTPGCYAPVSPHDILLSYKGGFSLVVPANIFLLPQKGFKQEVPKIPQIKNKDEVWM